MSVAGLGPSSTHKLTRPRAADLAARQHPVEARAFDVEDLAAQGEDRLVLAEAAAFGAAAGGVAFHQVQLGQGRVLLLAVGQLARQPQPVEHALAPRHLARLARGVARAASRARRLCRSANRSGLDPKSASLWLGFRVVSDVTVSKSVLLQ